MSTPTLTVLSPTCPRCEWPAMAFRLAVPGDFAPNTLPPAGLSVDGTYCGDCQRVYLPDGPDFVDPERRRFVADLLRNVPEFRGGVKKIVFLDVSSDAPGESDIEHLIDVEREVDHSAGPAAAAGSSGPSGSPDAQGLVHTPPESTARSTS